MKELKDLKPGDDVIVILKDLALSKTLSYRRGRISVVKKRWITVEIKSFGESHYYDYSVKTGNVVGHQKFDSGHRIEPWENDKHEPLWRRFNLALKTIRLKGELIEKINKIESEADNLEEQGKILENITRFIIYLEKTLEGLTHEEIGKYI